MDLIFRTLMTEVCPPDPEGVSFWPWGNRMACQSSDTRPPWSKLFYAFGCIFHNVILIMPVCAKVNGVIFLILSTKHEQADKNYWLLFSKYSLRKTTWNVQVTRKGKNSHNVIFNIQSSNIFVLFEEKATVIDLKFSLEGQNRELHCYRR